jgi:hypothetical protein
MNPSRKIAWEKFTPATDFGNFMPIEDEKEEDKENNWEEEEDEETDEQNLVNVLNNMDALLIKRRIKTPFGYYDIDDDFSPYNMFECWIGHTNFRLTKEDFNILDKKINGIGCLKVLSPYRFFIGIEKMFTFPAVRIQIQKDLCQNLDINDDPFEFGTDVDQTINMVISKINDALFSIKDSEKWAVFIGKDGEVKTIRNSEFESEMEYHNKLKMLKSLKNGNIITYDSL